MDPARLPGLKPYFRRDGGGSVTAGNSSPMTDGAAALVVASYDAVQVGVGGGRADGVCVLGGGFGRCEWAELASRSWRASR